MKIMSGLRQTIEDTTRKLALALVLALALALALARTTSFTLNLIVIALLLRRLCKTEKERDEMRVGNYHFERRRRAKK